jgi:hypothetical protein
MTLTREAANNLAAVSAARSILRCGMIFMEMMFSTDFSFFLLANFLQCSSQNDGECAQLQPLGKSQDAKCPGSMDFFDHYFFKYIFFSLSSLRFLIT